MGDRIAVGLDVHARSTVACAIDEATGEVRRARFGPDRTEVIRWVKDLGGSVRATYEAGPTGYVLAREMEQAGIRCVVCAPGKIPRAPGDRIKTDQRDAERLARLLKMDELTAVRVPGPGEEAARDLVRAREDARADLMRARHRLSKFMLRHGHLYTDGGAWSRRHEEWIGRIRLAEPTSQAVLEAYWELEMRTRTRRDELDRMIEEAAARQPFADIVRRLSAIRGISTLTAFALAVEIGDFHRFTGSSIGSFLGLVPSESSTGERTSRGAITKTGNAHARRLLVEAAWHHRKPPRPSAQLLRRREQVSPAVRLRAEQCQRRLHRRWTRLEAERGKRSTICAVAVARELAGWCWSIATMED